HHCIIFARVVQRGRFGAPADKLVGLARHGRNHHGDLVAGIDLALDVQRRLPDALDIGDGSAAEFHHNTRHDGALKQNHKEPYRTVRLWRGEYDKAYGLAIRNVPIWGTQPHAEIRLVLTQMLYQTTNQIATK